MDNYDIDLEIVYAIKKGHHNFNEIFSTIKRGSKITFSEHLEQLVYDGTIKRTSKNKKPQYKINDPRDFEQTEQIKGKIETEISNIKETSKKIPDKRLLKKFIKDTVKDLKFYSMFHFDSFLLSEFVDNFTFSEVFLNPNAWAQQQTLKSIQNRKLQLLNKLIGTRIAILQKRDYELVSIFGDLVIKQMMKN